jgi:hypothetical protein
VYHPLNVAFALLALGTVPAVVPSDVVTTPALLYHTYNGLVPLNVPWFVVALNVIARFTNVIVVEPLDVVVEEVNVPSVA